MAFEDTDIEGVLEPGNEEVVGEFPTWTDEPSTEMLNDSPEVVAGVDVDAVGDAEGALAALPFEAEPPGSVGAPRNAGARAKPPTAMSATTMAQPRNRRLGDIIARQPPQGSLSLWSGAGRAPPGAAAPDRNLVRTQRAEALAPEPLQNVARRPWAPHPGGPRHLPPQLKVIATFTGALVTVVDPEEGLEG